MKKRLFIIGIGCMIVAFLIYEWFPHKNFTLFERCIYTRVKSSFTKGEYARAQSSIDWLVERHPKNKDLLFNKACICIKQNEWSQARRVLKEVILMSPNDVEAKKWFLFALGHTGGTDELLSGDDFFKGMRGQFEDNLPSPLY